MPVALPKGLRLLALKKKAWGYLYLVIVFCHCSSPLPLPCFLLFSWHASCARKLAQAWEDRQLPGTKRNSHPKGGCFFLSLIRYLSSCRRRKATKWVRSRSRKRSRPSGEWSGRRRTGGWARPVSSSILAYRGYTAIAPRHAHSARKKHFSATWAFARFARLRRVLLRSTRLWMGFLFYVLL